VKELLTSVPSYDFGIWKSIGVSLFLFRLIRRRKVTELLIIDRTCWSLPGILFSFVRLDSITASVPFVVRIAIVTTPWATLMTSSIGSRVRGSGEHGGICWQVGRVRGGSLGFPSARQALVEAPRGGTGYVVVRSWEMRLTLSVFVASDSFLSYFSHTR
jgi:hypothetical protein